MSASVYDGESRALPRWLVVAMMLKTCIEVSLLLLRPPGPRSVVDAPWLLRLAYEQHWLGLGVAALAALAFVQFGRRREPLRWGTAGIVLVGYLAHAQSTLTGSLEKELFLCGAVTTGWLFGLAFCRELDRSAGRPWDADRADAFGEAGACGAISAIYVHAATSKLIESGPEWTDGTTLLAAIVNRRTFSSSGDGMELVVQALLNHPSWANVLSAATVIVQGATMCFFASARFKMLWSPLVIGFHVSAFFMMGVKYFTPILFLLAFSYPWPHIWRTWRGSPALAPLPTVQEDAPAGIEVASRHAVAWLVAAAVLALGLWWTMHHSDDTRLMHENFGEGRQPDSGDRRNWSESSR